MDAGGSRARGFIWSSRRGCCCPSRRRRWKEAPPGNAAAAAAADKLLPRRERRRVRLEPETTPRAAETRIGRRSAQVEAQAPLLPRGAGAAPQAAAGQGRT